MIKIVTRLPFPFSVISTYCTRKIISIVHVSLFSWLLHVAVSYIHFKFEQEFSPPASIIVASAFPSITIRKICGESCINGWEICFQVRPLLNSQGNCVCHMDVFPCYNQHLGSPLTSMVKWPLKRMVLYLSTATDFCFYYSE